MIEVTAAILMKNHKVLLARRRPGKHLQGFWELPGGKIEEGELPESCLERELQEEFGIQTKVGAHFVNSDYAYKEISVRLKAYFTEHISGKINPVDHDAFEWVDIGKLHTYKLAPADIPIIDKLQSYLRNS